MRKVSHQDFCELSPLQLLKDCVAGDKIEVRRRAQGSGRKGTKIKLETCIVTVRSRCEDGLEGEPHDILWCGCCSMGWFFGKKICEETKDESR